MRKQLRPLLVFIFLTGLGLSGMFLGSVTSKSVLAVAKDRYEDLQLFAKVLSLVQRYYVEEVDLRKLVDGGIKGMLKELDPHSNYLPNEIFKEFESETNGKFGGLGVEITVLKGRLTIISPIEDTPAWKAGLKSGDLIVSINGTKTKGLSLVESAQLMRGKLGSSVSLEIKRDGVEGTKIYKVTRAIVKLKSIKVTDLEDGYLYIRMTSFIESTSRDFKKSVKKFIKKNKEIKGLVIDLRRNPGGLLDQAIKVSDMFLDKGTIVSTIGRNKQVKDITKATEAGTYKDFPIVVLINEFSASASEILSGALQDNNRALIMGKRSFGKGSVQSVIKLGDGSGLKLTIARYYTPSGKSIQARGIIPDVELDDIDSESLEKALIKKKVYRESNISGHLMAEKRKDQEKDDKKIEIKESDKKRIKESMHSWRKKISGKKDKDLSKKERLLSKDYQVLQAFNYLKAWSVMQKIGVGKEESTTQ